MKTLLITLCCLTTTQIFSQDAEQVMQTITTQDSLFWVGYNTCNLDLMAQFLTEDMEFYHDLGGIISGVAGMKSSMQENICNDPNHHVRRELVPETFEVFLLRGENGVYGALVSGEHYFYNSFHGEEETRDGVAKFTNLWIQKDGRWKMSRIFSYDHQDL